MLGLELEDATGKTAFCNAVVFFVTRFLCEAFHTHCTEHAVCVVGAYEGAAVLYPFEKFVVLCSFLRQSAGDDNGVVCIEVGTMQSCSVYDGRFHLEAIVEEIPIGAQCRRKFVVYINDGYVWLAEDLQSCGIYRVTEGGDVDTCAYGFRFNGLEVGHSVDCTFVINPQPCALVLQGINQGRRIKFGCAECVKSLSGGLSDASLRETEVCHFFQCQFFAVGIMVVYIVCQGNSPGADVIEHTVAESGKLGVHDAVNQGGIVAFVGNEIVSAFLCRFSTQSVGYFEYIDVV